MEKKNYSKRTAGGIDDGVRERIDRLYQRVKVILLMRRLDLETIASALVRLETLEAEEIQTLLATTHQEQMSQPPHEVSSTNA